MIVCAQWHSIWRWWQYHQRGGNGYRSSSWSSRQWLRPARPWLPGGQSSKNASGTSWAGTGKDVSIYRWKAPSCPVRGQVGTIVLLTGNETRNIAYNWPWFSKVIVTFISCRHVQLVQHRPVRPGRLHQHLGQLHEGNLHDHGRVPERGRIRRRQLRRRWNTNKKFLYLLVLECSTAIAISYFFLPSLST